MRGPNLKTKTVEFHFRREAIYVYPTFFYPRFVGKAEIERKPKLGGNQVVGRKMLKAQRVKILGFF